MNFVRNRFAINATNFFAMGLAGLAVVVLSISARAGEWTIIPSIAIEQSVTDNARLAAGGEEADLITTATAGLSIVGQGRRAQLNFNYDISQDKFWDNGELDGLRQNLLGAGKVEAVEDFVFIDTRASISQAALQSDGGISATGRSVGTNDQSTVVNYAITPNFAHRYGNWAESDIRLSLTGTSFFDTDTGSATTQPDGSRSIFLETLVRSGPRFNKLSWELSGSKTFTNNGSDRDITELSGEYAWSRHLALLGAVGRETIENSGINQDDSAEIFVRAGARITPGPRSSFQFEVSNRFDDTTFSGEASYKFTSLTAIKASYAVSVQTDRETLVNNLNGLVLNDQGVLINPNTGQPGSPNDSVFDFRDQTTKQENFNIALNGASGRNTFGLFNTVSIRTVLPDGGNETVIVLGGNINRRIWPDLDGGISANISATTESIDGIEDVTIKFGMFLTYRLQKSLLGSVRYNYLNRDSDDDTADVRENVVSVNLSKSF